MLLRLPSTIIPTLHDEGYNMPSDILDDLASSDGNIEDKRFDFSHHIEVPELSNTLLDNQT